MLSDNNAIATVGVKNLEKSKEFYERTLGLTKVMENDEVLGFKSGASTLFVYRTPYAGTNKATAVTRQGDIHVAGAMRTAWFKDPDGNIFSVVTPPNTAEREKVAASARSTT
jgi:catechol 2,3-dioxygenase-like lactoylglutathione lyase family enzyme